MEHINNYTFFIALAITLCSLAIAVFSFLYYRKVKKECYVGLVRSIHEQERAKRELEHTRIDITYLGQNRAASKTNNIQYQPNKQN